MTADPTKTPFKIGIVENKPMGCHDLCLQVGGLAKEQAEVLAEGLADWMIDEGGWKARVQ